MITIYYLYVKTHKKTGLKYLGQTTAQNPYKYRGSGDRWNSHLNVHGYDIDTIIIQKCYTKTALRSWGVYYSNLWSVVDSKKWANLKPEEGQGGWGGSQNPNNLPGAKDRQRLANLGDKNNMKLPGVKAKVQKSTKIAMWKPDIRKRHLAGINSTSWKKSQSARVGVKAPNYDNTIYSFSHKNGTIETCTQAELRGKYGNKVNTTCLIKKKLKCSQGWRLILM